MKRISLPIGSSGFQDIRKSGDYYVDKTKIISEIIRDNARGIIFTRPRRFGKTTVQSMLASFFDIREDSEELFRGLDVYDDKEAVDNWMNKYPIIYLSFKDTEGCSQVSFSISLKATGSSLTMIWSKAIKSFSDMLL